MKITTEKETYCRTCDKDFHYLGIARHRAMHRDRGEDCTITFTNGDTYSYSYSARGALVNRLGKELFNTLYR